MQVNNYETKAAYEADNTRSRTASAVSKIVEESAAIFDGVNTVVYDKNLAGIGDLVVKDTVRNVLAFIKAGTVKKTQIPATLKPVAEVFGRKGDKVLITALENLSARWGHPFEVLISGINNALGGTLAIVVHNNGALTEEVDVSWEADASLESIAASINAQFQTLTDADDKAWVASVLGNQIVLAHNYYLKDTVDSITGTGGGAGVTFVEDDHNWQVEYAYLSGAEYIRRNNGVDTSFAGGNYKKFLDYYKTNGSVPDANVPLGSSTIVKQDAFENSEYCADLRAAYPDYSSYLFGEHFAQYPNAYGAMLRDGKETTDLLASLKGTVVRGANEPRFPAAAAAKNYTVADAPEIGWWLPSVEEILLLMADRRLNSADTMEDPFNDTAVEMQTATAYGNGYYPWTCCESNSDTAFIFGGYSGGVYSHSKYYTYTVRPVSAL